MINSVKTVKSERMNQNKYLSKYYNICADLIVYIKCKHVLMFTTNVFVCFCETKK